MLTCIQAQTTGPGTTRALATQEAAWEGLGEWQPGTTVSAEPGSGRVPHAGRGCGRVTAAGTLVTVVGMLLPLTATTILVVSKATPLRVYYIPGSVSLPFNSYVTLTMNNPY